MESSSDNSFAWSEASSDSPDSDDMAINNTSKNKSDGESDVDRKYKKELQNYLFSNNQTSDVSEEEVKQKDRKRKISNGQLESPNIKPPKKKRIKVEPESDFESTKNNVSQYEDSKEIYDQVKKKKNKSKKRKNSSDFNDHDDKMLIEDKFIAEETTVEKIRNGNKNRVSIIENNLVKDEIINKKNHSYPNDREVDNTHEYSAMECHIEKKNDRTIQNPHQRVSRISDRIRFEDEDSIDIGVTGSEHKILAKSKKVKKFLKSHNDLTALMPALPNGTILSQDKEIWAIRCPHDIDISGFQDLNLCLDKKSKIKVGDQTYEGSICEEAGNITLLSVEHSGFVIKNLPLNGTLNLRKKIPKVHIQEDNIMKNNQTDFIPLPETKCRHPLFGSNYKKAMKIPKYISERLNAKCDGSLHIKEEQKNKKKHRSTRKILTNDPSGLGNVQQHEHEVEEKSAQELTVIKKKSKKRKHTQDEDNPPSKKSKRIKVDLCSSEVWESETAIEESLFHI